MMTKKKSFESSLAEQQLQQQQQAISSPVSSPSLVAIESYDHGSTDIPVDSYESTSPIPMTPPPAKPPRHSDEFDSSSPPEAYSPPTKPPRHFSLYSVDNDDGLIQQTDTVVKKVLNLVDSFGLVSPDDSDMTILRQASPSIYVQQPSTNTEHDSLPSVSPSYSDSLTSTDAFTADPAQVSLKTEAPLPTEPLEVHVEKETTVASTPPLLSQTIDQPQPPFPALTESSQDVPSSQEPIAPAEITQLATNITASLFEELEKEFEKYDQRISPSSASHEDRENLLEQLSSQPLSSQNTFRDHAPSLPEPVATPTPANTESASQPVMFVSLDSGFNVAKAFSPLLNIVTTKPSPKVATSVTIISPPQPEISSTTTTTSIANTNSDDEEQLNSSSTLMPTSSIASDRSKFLQTSSKESSIDSNDTNPYDASLSQQLNAGSATPARSLISDYDNLHGSFGSLNDDAAQQQQQQQQQTAPAFPADSVPLSSSSETIQSMPTTNTSSISTIYETAENYSTSSSNTTATTTSPTYVSALSTLNSDGTSGSVTPAQRLNSDISDEDLVESYDVETPILTPVNPLRASKGRLASHATRQSICWHAVICLVFSHFETELALA